MSLQRISQLIVATALMAASYSFRLPAEKLDREERQAALLGSGENLGAGVGLGTQTINVDGQNVTVTGGNSGMSGGLSVESNEMLGLDPNMTSYLVRQLLGMVTNQPTISIGGRKKRQAIQLGVQGNGMVGQNMFGMFSNEGWSVETSGQMAIDANGTLSLVRPMVPGAFGGLMGDRKKRQVMLGQIPTFNMNGQNMLGIFSNEGLSGETSGQMAVDANGTLSLVRPMLPGGYEGLFFGDRKKRQVMLGQIPTMNMVGQNMLGAFSNEGLSGETSGQIAVDANGTLSLVRPMVLGGYEGLLFGDRKKRQVMLGQTNFQVPTYTFEIAGQNVTVPGGLSGLSMEASLGSGELFMNSNGTLSYLQPWLSGLGATNPSLPGQNNPFWLLGDRKKRQATMPQGTLQIPTFTFEMGGQNVTVAGGFSGLSMEASLGSGELFMNSNGTLSYLQPWLSGLGANNPALPGQNNPFWLLGDRKKRQTTMAQGTLQIPTFTLEINGQNVTVPGGFSGLSLENSFGSGEMFLNNNGTLSFLQPWLSGLGANNPALPGQNNPFWLLGDRKKRQATMPQGTLQIPTFTLEINGQNVTVPGGFSGLSLENSFGSGEMFLNNNGTLSFLQPWLSGLGANNPALPGQNNPFWLLGDRKKRQATMPQGTLQIPTFTLEINGQNVTVPGGFSGLSLENSFGSGEMFLNNNGTLSFLQPWLSGLGANNPALPGQNIPFWLLGDRKKRQATMPQGTLQIPTFTLEINGQNVTVPGGFSGLSLENSFGSGEMFLNNNGTLSFLQPWLSGLGANNPALTGQNNPFWLLGDRKKRQATMPQGTLQIPTFTLEINGQNVTVPGGFSGLSLENSLGSGEMFLNNNGTLSFLQPWLSGLGANNPALPGQNNPFWLLGDRKKRQATMPQGTLQIPTFTLEINGQNVTVPGGFSGLSLENSLGSGEMFLNNNGTLSFLQPGLSALGLNNQLNFLNLANVNPNTLASLFLLDRKRRQATGETITPEDLVLTAAAVDVQGRTMFPGADGDDGMAFGFGDGDTDGTADENLCVCSSQLCASWTSFIQTCRQIQGNSECVAALDHLIIIECPDSS